MERRLYFYDYLNREGSEIVAIIGSQQIGIFLNATQAALDETAQFQSRLRVGLAGFDIGRVVEIELGKPQDEIDHELEIETGKPLTYGYSVFFPIKWHAKDRAGLFPALDAKLEVVPLGDQPPLTQIGLVGSYSPPLGPLGTLGDSLIMHRLAEASVRNFVTDLAARLREP